MEGEGKLLEAVYKDCMGARSLGATTTRPVPSSFIPSLLRPSTVVNQSSDYLTTAIRPDSVLATWGTTLND